MKSVSKAEQTESTARRNTWPAIQKGLVSRNTRTNTSTEDKPWIDTDTGVTETPQALLASCCLPNPRRCGDGWVVEVAEDVSALSLSTQLSWHCAGTESAGGFPELCVGWQTHRAMEHWWAKPGCPGHNGGGLAGSSPL